MKIFKLRISEFLPSFSLDFEKTINMKTKFCFLMYFCSFFHINESRGLRIGKKTNIVTNTAKEDGRRQSRFLNPFSLFSIVQFPNTECTTASDDFGTCFTASEWTSKGGEANGRCAAGFGTCCKFSYTCGASAQQNGSYFVSPSAIPTECSLNISPLNDNICQV